MGHDGVKPACGDILKTQVLLDIFMKQLHGPAEPIPQYDLACRGFRIITGEILATTIRSFFWFGAHQLNLTHVAQIANRVSDAKLPDFSVPVAAVPTSWGN